MANKIQDEILSIGKNYSKSDISKKDSLIKKNLESLEEFRKAKTICFYISFESEAETHTMIRDALKGGKTVIIPFVEEKEIFLHELKDFDELDKGKFGILEPKKSLIRKFDPKKLDLVIIPGIVFDRLGHRIGFGEGYFDRLLGKTAAKKFALAYDFQIIEKLPGKSHDLKVDGIITDKEIIRLDK